MLKFLFEYLKLFYTRTEYKSFLKELICEFDKLITLMWFKGVEYTYFGWAVVLDLLVMHIWQYVVRYFI